MTFEACVGIPENNHSLPDLDGLELKTKKS